MIRATLWAVILGAAAVVVAPLMGHLHPALDSIGVGLAYGTCLAAGAAVLAAALRRRITAATAGGVALLGAAQLLAFADLSPRPGTALRLMQHNLNFANPGTGLADRLAQVDIAILQEVRDARPVLDALPSDWTSQHCPFAAVGGSAVVTRWPVTASGCLEGVAWMRIDTPDGPLTAASLHLHWPWPKGQHAHLGRILPNLAALPRPVVLGGDFNQMPWSASVARVAEAVDARIVPSLGTTFTLAGPLVRLNLDHILIPRTWTGAVEVSERFGSDHRALAARIGPVP